MKRRISANELRDRLLSQLETTEETRVEALSSPGNRELLGIIAIKQPRSISELAALAERLQPNVSRSLSALTRAGLVEVTHEGRASVPTLTREGQRRMAEFPSLRRGSESSISGEAPSPTSTETPALSARILETTNGDSADAVRANVEIRFPTGEGRPPLTARAVLNLNEICTGLLANWWRVLCRRADPYKLFPVRKEADESAAPAMLLAESTGRMELVARPALSDQERWGFPRLSLSTDDFTKLVLDELVRPLVLRLRSGKYFDLPAESMLNRTQEIMNNSADLAFWKSAGALGFSYQSMDDSAAAEVSALMSAFVDEDARLDFASAIGSGQLQPSLAWITGEVRTKEKVNGLPKLIELRRGTAIHSLGVEPWRIGKERAIEARKQLGLAQDRPVGGLKGLTQIFGGDDNFAPSTAGEEVVRGFQARGDNVPIIVVKDEGPNSTAFLTTRAIGDYLVHGSREAPITKIYSDRQAIGRAFAAEFMAPAQGVIKMIEEEDTPLVTVAQHYGVEREVVRRQYENNIAQYARSA